MTRVSWLVCALALAACGNGTGAVRPDVMLDDDEALLAENGQTFEGALGGQSFVPKSAIWGIESRQLRGGLRTHVLVVLMSNDADACSHWPRLLDKAGHRALIFRLSKLERGHGSAAFVEPDVGTYNVEQPSNPHLPITRGTEVLFRATPPPAVDVYAWLANGGAVQLTEHAADSSVVRGTFATQMVPFVLDDEPRGPASPVSGAFVAERCIAMDEIG